MAKQTDFQFNPIHPYFLRIDILSEDLWLGKEPNYENFQHIIKDKGWKQKFHGLDVICKDGQQNIISLLNALGFIWLMDCHELFVNPKSIKATKQPSVTSVKKAMAVIKFNDFKNFLTQRYIETHYWNPVSHLSPKEWDKLFDNNISLDFSVLSISNGQIMAASWASLKENHLDVIWTFAANRATLINRQKLVQQLILEQIRSAEVKEIKRVSFEIDSTDKDLIPALDLLTPREETIFKRYRLKFLS